MTENWSTILKREYSLKDILNAHEKVWFYYPNLPSHIPRYRVDIFMKDAFKELFNAYLKGNKLSTKMRINLKKLTRLSKDINLEDARILNNLSLTGRVKQFPHKVNDYTLYYEDRRNAKPCVILILISKSDIKIYLYRLSINLPYSTVMAEWKGNMVYIGNKYKDLIEIYKEIIETNYFGNIGMNIKPRYVDNEGQAYILNRIYSSDEIMHDESAFNKYLEKQRIFWDKKLKQIDSEDLTPLKTTPGVSE